MPKIINPKDRIGLPFKTNEGYNVIITDYINPQNCTIQFENGHVLENVRYTSIKNGEIKNPYHPSVCGVGFYGVGEYVSKINHSHTKEYKVWRSMLNRCYDLAYHGSKNYQNVYVCDEWKNFQIFAYWFNKEYDFKIGIKMELDKDILFKNNKIYSPNTCCFIPQEINKLLTNRHNNRGIFPIGVSQNSNKTFSCNINLFSENYYLGEFSSPELAFFEYKKVKEEHIKTLARKHKNILKPNVYDVLMSYEILITD